MADHKITDFVDQSAIDGLARLKAEITSVKEAYVQVAQELLRGIRVPVDGVEQLETLTRRLAELQAQAASATQRHSAALDEQTRIARQTSNVISRQLMEQEKLNEKTRDAYTRQREVKQILTEAVSSYDEMTHRLATIAIAQDKLNKEKQAEKKLYEENKITYDDYQQKLTEIIRKQQALAAEKSQLESYVKSEAKENANVSSSYNAMSQELARLKKAYRELDEEGRESEFGQNMLNEIKELGAHLKDMDASMGEFHRNVGDYAIACNNGVVVTEDLNRVLGIQASTVDGCIEQNKALEESKGKLNVASAGYAETLDRINAKISENNQRISDVSVIMNQTAHSVKEAEEQNKLLYAALKLVDLGSSDAREKIAAINAKIAENSQIIEDNLGKEESAKKQLKELVLEIAELTIKYREMSDAEKNSAEGKAMAEKITLLTERAGKLRDAIADTNKAITNMASDTRGFDQISQGIQLLTSGYGAAKGAATLLGIESKDLIAIQTKLQAAYVVTNSLTRVQALLQKESALMQAINTLQTKAATAAENMKAAAVGRGTVATIAATAAQKAFNLVAKANPYVLLALGAAAAITAISKFTSSTNKAKDATVQMSRAARQNMMIMDKQEEIIRGMSKVYIDAYMTAVREQMEFNKSIKDYQSLMQRTGAEELARLQILYRISQQENITRSERLKAIKEMKKEYPTYLGHFKDEEILAGKAAVAYQNLVSVMNENIRAKAMYELMVENQKRAMQEAYDYDIDIEEKQAIFDWYADKLMQHAGAWVLDHEGAFNNIYEHFWGDGRKLEETTQKTADELLQILGPDGWAEYLQLWADYYADTCNWNEKILSIFIQNRKLMEKYTPVPDVGAEVTDATDKIKKIADLKYQATKRSLELEKATEDAELAIHQEGTKEWADLKKSSLDYQYLLERDAMAKSLNEIRDFYSNALTEGAITEAEYYQYMEQAGKMLAHQLLLLEAKFNKEKMAIEKQTTENQIKEIQNRYSAEEAIRDNNLQSYIAKEKKILARKLMLAETDEERAKAQADYERRVAELTEDYALDAAQAQIEMYQEILKAAETTADERNRLENERTALENTLAKATTESERVEIQNRIDLINGILNYAGMSAEEREKIAQKLADAETQLAEAKADKEIAIIKRTTDADIKAKKTRIENAQEWLAQVSQALNAVNGLASAIYDNKIQKIEEEQEKQETAAQEEQDRITKLVEQKVITEEEGEARKRAAEVKSAKKQEELEKRKQKMQYQQAIWDKANSIAQAGINTALAIMSTISKLGMPAAIPFVAMASALGAIQMATIVATPIPKYAKGTDYHKGGLAVVGDGGRSELVSFGGQMYLTPDKPALVDIPRGAKVFPDADKLIALLDGVPKDPDKDPEKPRIIVNNDYSGLQREVVGIGNLIKRQTKAQQRMAYRADYERFKALKGL